MEQRKRCVVISFSFHFGLVYTMWDYFSYWIAFLNHVPNTLRSKPGNSPVTLFRGKTFHYVCHICCFLCLFAKQSVNLICIEAIRLSKLGLGAFRIGWRYLHVKKKTVRIVPGPFSCHLLMRSRVVPDCWNRAYWIHAEQYKNNRNPI